MSEPAPRQTFFGGPCCVCGHRQNIHRHGSGACGWYDEDAVSGRFDPRTGRAVRVKRGACDCLVFKPADFPPAF